MSADLSTMRGRDLVAFLSALPVANLMSLLRAQRERHGLFWDLDDAEGLRRWRASTGLLWRRLMDDGYYWARDVEGDTFIVLLENGAWYCCGVLNPINFDASRIIGPVPRLDH